MTGVQSEMELAFAGLHQLCAPMLADLGRIPALQQAALQTAFGVAAGPPPDRFLVGLAVLSLLSAGARERPLVCLIDDTQRRHRRVLAAVETLYSPITIAPHPGPGPASAATKAAASGRLVHGSCLLCLATSIAASCKCPLWPRNPECPA